MKILDCKTEKQADDYIANLKLDFKRVEKMETLFSSEINKVWWNDSQPNISYKGSNKKAHFNSRLKKLYIYD